MRDIVAAKLQHYHERNSSRDARRHEKLAIDLSIERPQQKSI